MDKNHGFISSCLISNVWCIGILTSFGSESAGTGSLTTTGLFHQHGYWNEMIGIELGFFFLILLKVNVIDLNQLFNHNQFPIIVKWQSRRGSGGAKWWCFYWLCKLLQPPCNFAHLPVDKMDAISQMIFSDVFLWMKSFVFWLNFHWSLFLRFQLTINQHVCR